MMSWCIGWGLKPTWNGSFIHLIHIQYGLDHSYEVDGQMDPTSCHYHHTCWHKEVKRLCKYCWSQGSCKRFYSALVEAPNPHGMVPTSTPKYSIMQIVPNILAQNTAILKDFLGHSEAANEVKVHWLRHQTDMEWFPHPLNSYTMCFRPFIWSGWTDGSNIMPLPPYLSAHN
jgi:hypothetical protein